MKFKLIIALVFASFGLLTARLVHLQLIEGAHYLAMADANRFYHQLQPAPRGVFLDRYNQPLAVNKKIYLYQEDGAAVYADQEPISRDEALSKMASQPAQISYQLRRYYHYPQALAHTLGYLSPVTVKEVQSGQAQLDAWTGKLGLEKQFEQLLKGQKGEVVYEVDSWGKKVRPIEERPSKPGQDIETSLDPYLSSRAFEALGENKGAVVILDGQNGQVLSLVSKPSFSANDLSFSLDDEAKERARQQAILDYLADEDQVFFNRAVSGAYPPGSVFKLVTALAGLDSEALDANKTVVDEGILEVGDYQYANWYYTQYGRTEGEVNLIKAISRSNDIYFYKAAEWTGPERLADYARLFGLGKATGVELEPEAEGLVPDPTWKEKTLGERWYLGNTYHFGIGQGDLLVSPMQVAQLTQGIVNQGEMCRPSLIKADKADCQGLGLKQEHLDLVLQGMLSACSAGGTAYPLFEFNQSRPIDLSPKQQIEQGYIACKTGTAEFGPADEQGYRKTHGWLAAVVGVDQEDLINQAKKVEQTGCSEQESSQRCLWLEQVAKQGFPSQLVVVVLVESDEEELFKEGSEHAGPVVKQIVEWIKG